MISIRDYLAVVGKESMDNLFRLAKKLKGKSILHINSTRTGGGVAEILERLVPFLNELGIEARWEVIKGDSAFFDTTKTFHNALQGLKGKEVQIADDQLAHYVEVNRENARRIDFKADVVVVHDPQPAALIAHKRSNKAKWIWRCHIDTARPARQVWKYLYQFISQYDASIFSMPRFAQDIPHPQFLIYPSIDPFSAKNRELPKEEVKSWLKKFNIKTNKPIILQVSRFDQFKDPVGVIQAYRMVQKHSECQLILAGGEATDDPEGPEMWKKVREAAQDDPDIHILLLPPESDIEINALQRAADVVVQKSLREGFGLSVTEAMWKEKPVVGGAAGGITLQVHNHYTGFLIHSTEGAAYRIRYLLHNPNQAKKMGKIAHEFVKNSFLITRHLRDYLTLMVVMQDKSKHIIWV